MHNHLDMIMSEMSRVLFDWDEPFVLMKFGK